MVESKGEAMTNPLSRIRDRAQFWNVTEAERSSPFPCDEFAEPDAFTVLRGIDVAASTAVTFRWVCQLKVAPYSYDWIDHRGHRSPPTLTPGADRLEIGQSIMVGRISTFEVGHHITGVIDPKQAERYRPVAMSYVVRPQAGNPDASRLLACLRIGGEGLVHRLMCEALMWGDLVMMRKQFLNLKQHAENSVRSTTSRIPDVAD